MLKYNLFSRSLATSFLSTVNFSMALTQEWPKQVEFNSEILLSYKLS